MLTRAQRLSRARKLSRVKTEGWGVEQLERRAAKASADMQAFDGMPKEYREIVTQHGQLARVRSMMQDGWPADEIAEELAD